jgi:TM2 domain-containing membrane protein YozV
MSCDDVLLYVSGGVAGLLTLVFFGITIALFVQLIKGTQNKTP